MELLLLLLTAHFIADFYLKPVNAPQFSNNKQKKPKALWLYFLLHALLYITVFLIAELPLFPAIFAIFIISLGHWLSIYWKLHRVDNLKYFLLDQIIKILIITFVWVYLANITLAQVAEFIVGFVTAKHMIVAISYLLVCKPASVIISLALKKHTDNLQKAASETQANEKVDSNENIGLLSAGAWIGYIERCLAISFIFMGQFAGIGFLVATKTIFRFGDLTKNKDMKLTEYMMLGTLLSYAIALFVGWNAMQIYHAIS